MGRFSKFGSMSFLDAYTAENKESHEAVKTNTAVESRNSLQTLDESKDDHTVLMRICSYLKRNIEKNKAIYPKADLANYLASVVEDFSGWSETTLMQTLNAADLIEISPQKEHLIPNN